MPGHEVVGHAVPGHEVVGHAAQENAVAERNAAALAALKQKQNKTKTQPFGWVLIFLKKKNKKASCFHKRLGADEGT